MTTMKKQTGPGSVVRLAAAGLIAAAVAGGAVSAHENATGVVKERMDMMDKLGDSMKALKSLVRGKSDLDSGRVIELAEEIREMSNHIGAKFPEGSNEMPSEALPAIWEDWDRFNGLITRMRDESARLGAVAAEGDRRSVLKQFIALGKTCKSCHTDFRQKKN